MYSVSLLVIALIGSAYANAPYPAPHKEYGVPHQVYGVPEIRKEVPLKPVYTEYKYEIPAKPAPKLAPYPASAPYAARIEKPIVPHTKYGVPTIRIEAPSKPVFTEYKYEIPATPALKLAPYPASAPYPARTENIVVPHTNYGVPAARYEAPAKPVFTEYKYEIPATPALKLAPYPAPAPYPARIEKVVVPHTNYGVPAARYEAPAKPVFTEYKYEIPATPALKLAPYPASAPYPARTEKVVVPHTNYGVPAARYEAPAKPVFTEYKYEIPATPALKLAPYPAPAPYPARIEKVVVPHSEYGVPVARYEAPAKPVFTEYKYEIPATPALKLAPYPASAPYPARTEKVVVPHTNYGVPAARYEAPAKPVFTEYKYEIPATPALKLAPYPASAPYPARTEKVVVPHTNYGVPAARYEAPAKPVFTEYKYEIPATPALKLAPYPAPAPYPARIEKVVVPHSEYGVPVARYEAPAKPVFTEYKYEIPATPTLKLAPYPASAPYAARIEKPVVPHTKYGVPTARYEAPAKPVFTEYKYEIPDTPVVKLAPYPASAPYPARIEKPHAVYGVPQ